MMKSKHTEGADWLTGILHSDCTTFPKISGTKRLSKAHCVCAVRLPHGAYKNMCFLLWKRATVQHC